MQKLTLTKIDETFDSVIYGATISAGNRTIISPCFNWEFSYKGPDLTPNEMSSLGDALVREISLVGSPRTCVSGISNDFAHYLRHVKIKNKKKKPLKKLDKKRNKRRRQRSRKNYQK